MGRRWPDRRRAGRRHGGPCGETGWVGGGMSHGGPRAGPPSSTDAVPTQRSKAEIVPGDDLQTQTPQNSGLVWARRAWSRDQQGMKQDPVGAACRRRPLCVPSKCPRSRGTRRLGTIAGTSHPATAATAPRSAPWPPAGWPSSWSCRDGPAGVTALGNSRDPVPLGDPGT